MQHDSGPYDKAIVDHSRLKTKLSSLRQLMAVILRMPIIPLSLYPQSLLISNVDIGKILSESFVFYTEGPYKLCGINHESWKAQKLRYQKHHH